MIFCQGQILARLTESNSGELVRKEKYKDTLLEIMLSKPKIFEDFLNNDPGWWNLRTAVLACEILETAFRYSRNTSGWHHKPRKGYDEISIAAFFIRNKGSIEPEKNYTRVTKWILRDPIEIRNIVVAAGELAADEIMIRSVVTLDASTTQER